jgi:hypothetical protein
MSFFHDLSLSLILSSGNTFNSGLSQRDKTQSSVGLLRRAVLGQKAEPMDDMHDTTQFVKHHPFDYLCLYF